MERYINAAALAEVFRDMAEFADEKSAVALRAAADAAEAFEPAPDVGEVRSGEWKIVIGYYGKRLVCPFCGYETRPEIVRNEGWTGCPVCLIVIYN